MTEQFKWYVIHTYSAYEKKVAASIQRTVENHHLENLIETVRIPSETIITTENGVRKEKEHFAYPGYVLVKMILNNESWQAVRGVRGVTGFVGSDNKAVPLTEEEVAQMGIEKVEINIPYAVGDSVTITEGALTGFLGVVEEIEPEKMLVRVVVSMFGRETPVELALDEVEPAVN